MNTPIQNRADLKEPKHENLYGSKGVGANEETGMSMKSPDTTLSMIVLLLACLALAALAHVIV